MKWLGRIIIYGMLLASLYVAGLMYFTLLREYSGASEHRDLELQYQMLNSEYNACLDRLRYFELKENE